MKFALSVSTALIIAALASPALAATSKKPLSPASAIPGVGTIIITPEVQERIKIQKELDELNAQRIDIIGGRNIGFDENGNPIVPIGDVRL